MRQGWLGAYWWRGATVLEVFGQFGLGVVELQNFDFVGVGENHHWLEDGIDLSLQDLMHHFQFSDVSFEVQRVG